MFRSGVLLLAFFAILIANRASGEKRFRTRNTGSVRKVVGGEIVSISDHPYHVAVGSSEKTGERNYCGGTLIAPLFILTAAHCVKAGNEELTYIHSSYDNNRNRREKLLTVKTITIHPGYEVGRVTHDIAVLELFEPYRSENGKCRPVHLPNFRAPKGALLIAVGWGSSSFETMDDNSLLKMVVMKVLPSAYCKAISFTTNITYEGCSDRVIKGTGVSHGDSGGGLINNNTIFGVISTLLEPTSKVRTTYFTRYVDVYQHLDFIESVATGYTMAPQPQSPVAIDAMTQLRQICTSIIPSTTRRLYQCLLDWYNGVEN